VLTLLHLLSSSDHVVHLADASDDAEDELVDLLLRSERLLPSAVVRGEAGGSREEDGLALGDDLLECVCAAGDEAAGEGTEVSSRARDGLGGLCAARESSD
jgi:hypothetical protein